MSAIGKTTSLFNYLAGTWRLPGGHDMPDITENSLAAEAFHARRAHGDKKSWAYFRTAGMLSLEYGLRAKAGFTAQDAAHELVFRDDTGKTVAPGAAGRCLFFLGSGLDRSRKVGQGIKEFQIFQRSLLGLPGGASEQGPVSAELEKNNLLASHVYLYEDTPGAWFKRLKEAYYLNAKPDFYGAEAQNFVERMFVPVLAGKIESNNDGTGCRNPATGRLACHGKLDRDSLNQALRWNLAGQSYGGTFIAQIVSCVKDYMADLGYTQAEAGPALKNIFVYNINAAAPVAEQGLSATTIFVEDVKDFLALQMSRDGIYPDARQNPALLVAGNPKELAISADRRFFWIDVARDQLLALAGENYGYHDIRLVTANVPAKARSALAKAYDRTTGLRPLRGLSDLTVENRQQFLDTQASFQ